MKVFYYFAYGSNMHPLRMATRCPSARVVGNAVLAGYTVAERLYADIEPQPGARVSGVLYTVTGADLASLDRFEGCPKCYRRRFMTVVTRGRMVEAAVYAMTPETRLLRQGMPFPDAYREICSSGARFHRVRNAFERKERSIAQ